MGCSVSSHNFLVFNMKKYLAFQFLAQIMGVISIKVVNLDEIGSSYKQYAPKYPYTVDAVSYQKHPLLSKLSWALSPKLVPPPPQESDVEDDVDVDALYKHYYYATEDNADMFYEPYMGVNIEDVSMEAHADDYYKPYFHQSAEGVQYYGGRPKQNSKQFLPSLGHDQFYQAPTQFQELPKLSQGARYRAPMMELNPGQRYQAPTMSVWDDVDEADNEIFDMPKIFLKSIN